MDRLVVHTVQGVVEVPLTGNKRFDDLLERWARKGGGAVLRRDGAFEAEAKERQKAGQREGGHTRHGSTMAELPPSRKARDDAAAAVGVSPRYVQEAETDERAALQDGL